jgi:modulator of FtsH protease HflK
VLKESLMLTDDENIIDIQFAVQYILKSPEDYLFNNRDTDDSVCRPPKPRSGRSSARARWTSCLYEGREQVAAQATKLMQEILDRYKHRDPDQQGHDAERAAARAGAGGLR